MTHLTPVGGGNEHSLARLRSNPERYRLVHCSRTGETYVDTAKIFEHYRDERRIVCAADIYIALHETYVLLNADTLFIYEPRRRFNHLYDKHGCTKELFAEIERDMGLYFRCQTVTAYDFNGTRMGKQEVEETAKPVTDIADYQAANFVYLFLYGEYFHPPLDKKLF